MPSKVTSSLPLSSCKRAFFSLSLRCSSCIADKVASSGSIYTTPLVPSTTPSLPLRDSSMTISEPIKAGIPIVLARMAVCELTEPFCVTNDNILLLSIWTVSDGARSSATIITGSAASTPLSVLPESIPNSLSVMSLTSAALPRIYSSSMAANICEKLSPVWAMAYSAFTI